MLLKRILYVLVAALCVAALGDWSERGASGSGLALADLPASRYTVVDLGFPSPAAINSAGQIVGYTRVGVNQHALLWSGGDIRDLGTLSGAGDSEATGINDSGQVVGTSNADGFDHPFIWQNGAMTPLSELPFSNSSRATAISNTGFVVGQAHLVDPSLGLIDHAFRWQSGAVSDLGTPQNVKNAWANAGNDSGQAAGLGQYREGSTVKGRATVWRNGVITDLGALGGVNGSSQAFGINDAGDVVGITDTSAGFRAFIWTGGVMTALGGRPGLDGSIAADINNRGQVVGSSHATGEPRDHASLWEGGALTDLNDLIDPASGWVLTRATAINDGGQIVGVGLHAGAAAGFVLNAGRRPVFIIPGIGGTYAADLTNDAFWLTHRGIDPSQLQIDPLSGAYDDLIQTLENVGYVHGEDLFVVNYDWRMPPGPDDGVIDGEISGVTGASITSGTYRYGVDYLGMLLQEAAETWATNHPGEPPLDAVDVIAHSTGGLVARTYIESVGYGDTYAPGKHLPRIDNLIMVGVPNRGASKAWNPLHDNWGGDIAFQAVLSKIVNRAYQKVVGGGVIAGPDYDITQDSLIAPQCQDAPEICFIGQYIPTARALLATYDFIDFGSGFTNVNNDLDVRNSLVLDLNAGLDRTGIVGDANAFADLANVTVIYGTNGGDTPTGVVEEIGPTNTLPGFRPIAPFADFLARDAGNFEVYYTDITTPDAGDGTVPLESSIGQFLLDPRVSLLPFTHDGNTTGSVAHTELPSNIDVQTAILGKLGITVADPSFISTGDGGYDPAIICAATGCFNFILDPVEGFVVDGLGRRLGYTTATGRLTEIPGSIWFGNADGMGWIFGAVEEPLSVELTGLGSDYYVMLSSFNGSTGGLISDGFLAQDEHLIIPVPHVSEPSETATPTVTSTPIPDTPTLTPTATATPDPDDLDGDGYTNTEESDIGENPNQYCGIMRADVDGDGAVSILDFTDVARFFLRTVPPAPHRMDQGATYDDEISILDFATMSQYFLKHVTDCPDIIPD